MVDFGNSSPTCSPPVPPIGERLKIKNIMGRAPAIGVLKTKFLTVLGNSNELLNGISNKLALSLSSSDSDYCGLDEIEEAKLLTYEEPIDYTKIDYESRRVKARRAHEEIISGRYRHPNLITKPFVECGKRRSSTKIKRSSSSSSSSSTNSSSTTSPHSIPTNAVERSVVSSTTRSNSLESRHSGGYGRPGRAIPGARRSEIDMQKDLLNVRSKPNVPSPHSDVHPQITLEWNDHAPQSQQLLRMPVLGRTSNSSTLTSLRDDPDIQASPSIESLDFKNLVIRSESQNSVPSWASSISLDCHSAEEPIKQFMKTFTDQLFISPSDISAELKAEFGSMVHLEAGRQWFTRFLLEQRTKSKRVGELTFHSLVQHFGIVLFECSECEDFKPATIIMNLSFVFFHEIDVPGCEPYREYLFSFMQHQPLWETLVFWNAAFADAIQPNESERRQSLKGKPIETDKTREAKKVLIVKNANKPDTSRLTPQEEIVSIFSNSSSSKLKEGATRSSKKEPAKSPDIKENEAVALRHLSAFTCNMHALGVSQTLNLEFFNRQVAILNFPNDKVKPLRDNICRMYHETQMWGAKKQE